MSLNREEVLESALDCITNDRANTYGKPEELDVAMLMVLVKIARTKSSPEHSDNYVDMAGYSALASELGKE